MKTPLPPPWNLPVQVSTGGIRLRFDPEPLAGRAVANPAKRRPR